MANQGSHTSLQAGFEQALSEYPAARQSSPFTGSHPMSSLFQSMAQTLRAADVLKEHVNITVTASTGQGNWAAIPWIALIGEGSTIQSGVYCADAGFRGRACITYERIRIGGALSTGLALKVERLGEKTREERRREDVVTLSETETRGYQNFREVFGKRCRSSRNQSVNVTTRVGVVEAPVTGHPCVVRCYLTGNAIARI